MANSTKEDDQSREVDSLGDIVFQHFTKNPNVAALRQAAQTLEEMPGFRNQAIIEALANLVKTHPDKRIQQLAAFAEELVEPHKTSAIAMAVIGLLADKVLPDDSPLAGIVRSFQEKGGDQREATNVPEDSTYTNLRQFKIKDGNVILRFDTVIDTSEVDASLITDTLPELAVAVKREGGFFEVTVPLSYFSHTKSVQVKLSMVIRKGTERHRETDIHDVLPALLTNEQFAQSIRQSPQLVRGILEETNLNSSAHTSIDANLAGIQFNVLGPKEISHDDSLIIGIKTSQPNYPYKLTIHSSPDKQPLFNDTRTVHYTDEDGYVTHNVSSSFKTDTLRGDIEVSVVFSTTNGDVALVIPVTIK